MALSEMMILLVALAVVQVFARGPPIFRFGPPPDADNITEANLNSMFDHHIDLIKRMIYEKNLDPLTMPDRILGISDSVPFGKLHLHNGWVEQLATIKRTGDVIARYHSKNITVQFDLGWDDINVNYKYALKGLFYTREGDFHGYFNNIRISAQGTINLENYNLDLKYFNIIDTGHFSFELTGHIADYLINAITRVVTIFAKDRIIREIEYQFINSIREKIDEINELLPEPMKQKYRKHSKKNENHSIQ